MGLLQSEPLGQFDGLFALQGRFIDVGAHGFKGPLQARQKFMAVLGARPKDERSSFKRVLGVDGLGGHVRWQF